MPEKPVNDKRKENYIKGLVILIGALVVVANIFLGYYAKLYLIDKPAISLQLHASQLSMAEGDKGVLVTVDFENTGIREYVLPLVDEHENELKPIKISKISRKGQSSEISYDLINEVCLPSSFPEGKDHEWTFRCVHSHTLEPRAKGSVNAVAAVPGSGLYFVEFNVREPYCSVWLRAFGPCKATYSYATAVVEVK
jgi:hypothetical protein